MGRWRKTTACERAQQWISLELDDELDELERAALERHLGRCVTCDALAVELSGIAQVLRTTPALDGPPVAVPAAPRRRAVSRVGAVAALAVAAAAAIVVVVPRGGPTTASALAQLSLQQRLAFVRDQHTRIEPTLDTHAFPTPSPLAERALD